MDYHLTEVPSTLGRVSDVNDRFDNTASVTFTWQATRHLLVQPYYRFQYAYYQHNTLDTSDRNDYLQSVGVALPIISTRAPQRCGSTTTTTGSSRATPTRHPIWK